MLWVLVAMMSGRYPTYRHDNVEFKDSSRLGDAKRARKSGDRLMLRGACIQKRADWAWLKQTLGLCGWGGEEYVSGSPNVESDFVHSDLQLG